MTNKILFTFFVALSMVFYTLQGPRSDSTPYPPPEVIKIEPYPEPELTATQRATPTSYITPTPVIIATLPNQQVIRETPLSVGVVDFSARSETTRGYLLMLVLVAAPWIALLFLYLRSRNEEK